MVTIEMTDQFHRDFEAWLTKHYMDNNGLKFGLMSMQARTLVIEDFVPEQRIENRIYTKQIPTLNLRANYRNPEVEYEEFIIKPEHFTAVIFNPWLKKDIQINFKE